MKLHSRSSENRRRSGLSLVIVMIAISMSMVLTYAALSSQARGVQMRQNVSRKEMARQAAESGAAIALNQMQSTAWSGVATPLSGTLSSNKVGSTTYEVTFVTIDGQTSPSAYPTGHGQTSLSGSSAFFDANATGLSTSSADTAATATRQAFQLLVRSAGKWQSATDPLDFVTETIDVGVELQPRVPGRPIIAPDITQATDEKACNAGYDTIQNYALFASKGSSSHQSLELEPGQRVDGPCWLKNGVSVFSSSAWSTSTRNEFLQSTGTLFTSSSGGVTSLLHPHPFGGSITMAASFSSSEITDLTNLNVPRFTAASTPTPPTISLDGWKTYQLYQGGFTYFAESLSSGTLNNVVLRPSQRNPLGVFYRNSPLTIGDNVVVQGTLVSSGKITCTGNNVSLSSVNWRDSSGAALVSNGNLFRRLPAIVADGLKVDSATRASVDGAVLLTNTMTGGDDDFGYMAGVDVDLSGANATCMPIRQPYSQVQLPSGTALTGVVAGGTDAIWLAEGNSGNWFPIIEVDATARRLTILGEATRSSPTAFRIRRSRIRNFDVRGPVLTTRASLSVSTSWKLNGNIWDNQYTLWQLATSIEAASGLPITPFVTWVANPLNYLGWSSPWEVDGLPLEPILHIRPQTGIKFRDSLPLFQSYVPPSNLITATNDPSGYRWRVLFWRDMP